LPLFAFVLCASIVLPGHNIIVSAAVLP
jgi:hypothetical protein